jgi:hypothetical protein
MTLSVALWKEKVSDVTLKGSNSSVFHHSVFKNEFSTFGS